MTTLIAALSDDVLACLYVGAGAVVLALTMLAICRGGHPRSRRP